MIKIIERIDNIGDMFYNEEKGEEIKKEEKHYEGEEYLIIEDSILVGYDEEYDGEAGGHIDIPKGVTKIGNEAFYGCTSLKSITIPNSVTSIGDYAFEDCCSLESINIPDSVTSIGFYAFLRCTSLKSITIPESVTSIGAESFWDCYNLTIKCYKNSVADEYAKRNHIKVEYI